MIRVKTKREGDRQAYFELLRIYYPSYEEGPDLHMDVKEEGSCLAARLAFPDRVFETSLKTWGDHIEDRHALARWLVRDVKGPGRVPSKWGILTGTRPVKFALKRLETYGPDKLVAHLRDHYLLDEDLAGFLVDLAGLELDMTRDLDPEDYALYINIPFCPSRCHYCSYPTMVTYETRDLEAYMASLFREMDLVLGALGRGPSLVYVGGGTPTSLTLPLMEGLLDRLGSLEGVREFCLEAGRPDTLGEDMLDLLASSHVTRLSINPQTALDRTLDLMGRPHTFEDIRRVYQEARARGFDNINMDLILGLPGEDEEDFLKSLDRVIGLGPENITIHTLSYKNGSKLFERGGARMKKTSQLDNGALEACQEAGYSPYYLYKQKRILGNAENIGYTRPTYACIYNMVMMEELATVIGLGMGSTSKILNIGGPSKKRIAKGTNYRNLKDYEEDLDKMVEKKLGVLKEMGWLG